MNLATAQHGNYLVVTPDGARLDALHVLRFKEAMRDIITNHQQSILLDMQNITFLDSSGLGALVGITKLMPPDCTLELANIMPMVEKVFQLTHMDKVFVIHAEWPVKAKQAS